MVGRDFNVIRFVNEKRPSGRITRSMRDFKEFVKVGGLCDCSLYNAKFTWMNEQDIPIMCKLDRFLVSGDWEEFYLHYFQEVKLKLTLDHWPVVLQTSSQSFGPKLFRFENMWTSHPSFKELVSA